MAHTLLKMHSECRSVHPGQLVAVDGACIVARDYLAAGTVLSDAEAAKLARIVGRLVVIGADGSASFRPVGAGDWSCGLRDSLGGETTLQVPSVVHLPTSL